MKDKKYIWKWIFIAMALGAAYCVWLWQTTEKSYYPNGNLRSTRGRTPKVYDYIYNTGNNSHGYYANYYENGQISEEGYIDTRNVGLDGQGSMDGKCTWWAPNGQIIDQVRYKYGKPVDGIRLSYYENGAKKGQVIYKGGVENGTHMEWGADGRILDQWEYVKDVPADGRRIILYPNGANAHEINYRNGGQIWKEFEWYLNGKLKTENIYETGILQRIYRAWSEEGKLFQEDTYKADGTRIQVALYRNGNKKYEIHTDKGNHEFIRNYWYMSGEKKCFQKQFVGKGIDLTETWYPDGSKRSRTKYVELEVSENQEWSTSKYSFSKSGFECREEEE